MNRVTKHFFLLLLLSGGCVQTIAIRTVGGILDYGWEVFNEESDLQLAKESIGSNLKLVEALLKGDPGNEKLLLLACQGYSSYSLAFVEDDSVERARDFYRRGRDFGLQILDENEKFRASRGRDLDSFERSLEELSDDDVPAIFWTAFGWGSYINVHRSDPDALADLPRVNAMMNFVAKRNPGYYYGGALAYLGMFAASTPPMMGGNPERGRKYFEESISRTNGTFLMTYVYFAQSYAMQTLNQALFDSLLTIVDERPLEILPEARLPNAVAKRKAGLLRTRGADFF